MQETGWGVVRIRLILLLGLAAIGVVAVVPTATASSVTNTGISLYHQPSGALPVTEVEAGWQGGLRVSMNPATALGPGNTVAITGPAGTVFDNGLSTTNVNFMTNETTGPGSYSTIPTMSITNGGRTITLEVPSSINVAPGENLGVRLTLYQQLISFGTVAGSKTMQVSTSQDTTPVDTPTYEITPAAAVAPVPLDGEQVTAVNQNFSSLRVGLFDQYGNTIAGEQVTATVEPSGASGTFPGDQTSVNVETGSEGEAVLPALKANEVVGQWELDLEGPGALHNDYLLENLVHTDAASVEVTLAPSSVPADGTSKSIATATVTDEFGNPVPGDDLGFFASGGQAIGPVTDNGDGSYEAELTATTSVGESTITATDSTPGTPVAGQTTLTQTALPAKTIVLKLAPSSIPADGKATTTATANVRDALGNPVTGTPVKLSSTGGQKIAAIKNAGQGNYTAVLTASSVAGSSEITATVTGTSPVVSTKTSLTQTAVAKPVKPVLKFISPPKKKVKSAKVKFRFKVVKGKARGFQCRLDRKKWTKCKSPRKVKLKKGKHVFKVRGVATDGTFGKPIVRKVKRF